MFTFITFDSNFGSSTMAYAGGIVGDFQNPLTLIIGVLLAMLIIGGIIAALHKH